MIRLSGIKSGDQCIVKVASRGQKGVGYFLIDYDILITLVNNSVFKVDEMCEIYMDKMLILKSVLNQAGSCRSVLLQFVSFYFLALKTFCGKSVVWY